MPCYLPELKEPQLSRPDTELPADLADGSLRGHAPLRGLAEKRETLGYQADTHSSIWLVPQCRWSLRLVSASAHPARSRCYRGQRRDVADLWLLQERKARDCWTASGSAWLALIAGR